MRDHWIFGPGNHVRFTPSGPEYLGQVPMWSLEGVSSIADSAGNLVAYAYPGAVFHAGFDTVVNGVLDWSCLLPGGRGSSTTQGSMFLPGEQDLWHLFTIRGDSTGCGRYLYHDSIRISSTTGMAELVSPSRKPVSPIQVSERLTAVRHGNGMDWWVLTTNVVGVSSGFSDQLLVFHLSEDTIQLESAIAIDLARVFGELVASPDGSLLALPNGQFTLDTTDRVLSVFEFDRCNGLATLQRRSFFNRGMYGAEFSESGRYLYISTQYSSFDCAIFQLDVEDIFSIPIRVYDCRSPVVGRAVGQMERGPDGKIYFPITNNSMDNITGYLNAIIDPDSSGSSCHPMEEYLLIASSTFFYYGLPNHPNYYLGPDPRCSGDTTNTDTTSAIAPMQEALSWKVYPTMAQGTVTVETSSPGGDITVLDAMGKTMLSTPIEGRTTFLETGAWPGGVYLVVLSHSGRVLGTRTVIRPW
jgi:hypothetical protein